MITVVDTSYRPGDDTQPDFDLLSNSERPLVKRRLGTLSDLDQEQLATFRAIWRGLSTERRKTLISEMRTLSEDNVDLDFRQIFLACLEDPDEQVRAISIDGLWEDDHVRTLHRLLVLARNDPAARVRTAALLTLSRFAYQAEMGELTDDDSQAVHLTLITTASDPTEAIDAQRRAIEALGYLAPSSEAAQNCIEQAYHHERQPMRESAIIAMGRSMLPRWFSYIEEGLQSRLPALRYAAVQAAGELGEEGQSLLSRLLPLVDDDDEEVSLATLSALGQIGGPHSKRILTRLAGSADEARRQAAEDALQELTLDEL